MRAASNFTAVHVKECFDVNTKRRISRCEVGTPWRVQKHYIQQSFHEYVGHKRDKITSHLGKFPGITGIMRTAINGWGRNQPASGLKEIRMHAYILKHRAELRQPPSDSQNFSIFSLKRTLSCQRVTSAYQAPNRMLCVSRVEVNQKPTRSLGYRAENHDSGASRTNTVANIAHAPPQISHIHSNHRPPTSLPGRPSSALATSLGPGILRRPYYLFVASCESAAAAAAADCYGFRCLVR